MTHSSELCRAQEREQLARAADATLANVRMIAERAAKAWAVEAASMEKAEGKRAKLTRTRRTGDGALPESPDNEVQA